LSNVEKKFHMNVTKGINVAHTKTLIKWFRPIATERELTICLKCESRRSSGRLQTLDRFIIWRVW